MTLAYRAPNIPDSPLARWDPRWKLAGLLLLALGITTLRSPWLTALGLVIALVLALLARIPRRQLVERMVVLGLGLLPLVLVLPLSLEGEGRGWSVLGLFISEHGIAVALGVMFRCLAIGALALVLLGTVPLPRTLAAAHHLRVPGVFVQVAQIAYRYTFLVFEEARRMRIALRVRGFRPRTSGHTYRTLGHLAASLIVRGGERAEQVAAAMQARGFDGTYRTLVPFRTTASDIGGFACMLLLTVALVLGDRW